MVAFPLHYAASRRAGACRAMLCPGGGGSPYGRSRPVDYTRSRGFHMTTVYEYWQHQASGEIWAVKLSDGEVVGATEIGRADVHEEILPHLSYRSAEADQLDRQRDHFKKIDGRKVE